MIVDCDKSEPFWVRTSATKVGQVYLAKNPEQASELVVLVVELPRSNGRGSRKGFVDLQTGVVHGSTDLTPNGAKPEPGPGPAEDLTFGGVSWEPCPDAVLKLFPS